MPSYLHQLASMALSEILRLMIYSFVPGFAIGSLLIGFFDPWWREKFVHLGVWLAGRLLSPLYRSRIALPPMSRELEKSVFADVNWFSAILVRREVTELCFMRATDAVVFRLTHSDDLDRAGEAFWSIWPRGLEKWRVGLAKGRWT